MGFSIQSHSSLQQVKRSSTDPLAHSTGPKAEETSHLSLFPSKSVKNSVSILDRFKKAIKTMTDSKSSGQTALAGLSHSTLKKNVEKAATSPFEKVENKESFMKEAIQRSMKKFNDSSNHHNPWRLLMEPREKRIEKFVTAYIKHKYFASNLNKADQEKVKKDLKEAEKSLTMDRKVYVDKGVALDSGLSSPYVSYIKDVVKNEARHLLREIEPNIVREQF
jgi:hypothetical protein